MLSRVAERVYWMARYIERAENTARLVNVYANLLLDLPRGLRRIGWRPLAELTGGEALFDQRYPRSDERSIVHFLLAEGANPGSILTSLSQARENVRTTRDAIPREAWEQINELFHYIRDAVTGDIGRRGRYAILKEIILSCQQLTGLLFGTMSHDSAYDFIRLGRNLERADMTTRILDAGASNLLREQPADLSPFNNILWMNVLKSLSAYQMYRLHVRNRVQSADVAAYLLQDPQFPRTVQACLNDMVASLQNLPNNDAPLRSTARLQRRVNEAQVPALLQQGLHEFIDELQRDLAVIHDDIAAAWFLLEESA